MIMVNIIPIDIEDDLIQGHRIELLLFYLPKKLKCNQFFFLLQTNRIYKKNFLENKIRIYLKWEEFLNATLIFYTVDV